MPSVYNFFGFRNSNFIFIEQGGPEGENKVLRRIFGPKRDVVTGEWRKLHNEELRDSYFCKLDL
jgi:hypothetical protein